MSSRNTQLKDKGTAPQQTVLPTSRDNASDIHQEQPATIIQRATLNPNSLTQRDIFQLQRTIGNRQVCQLLSSVPQHRPEINAQSKNSTQKTTVIQRTPFQINQETFDTKDFTYEELNAVLIKLIKAEDFTSILSLRAACKSQTKKSDPGKLDSEGVIKILSTINEYLANPKGFKIEEPQEGKKEKKEEKKEEQLMAEKEKARKLIESHKYRGRAEQLGLLEHPQIKYWLAKHDIPESNTKGIIAEILTHDMLLKKYKENPNKKVLPNVTIRRKNPKESKYLWTIIKELDNMVVEITDKKYKPFEIIETKAGTEGHHVGKIKTSLIAKSKALKTSIALGFYIFTNEEDITSLFDMEAMEDANLSSSTIYGTSDYQLQEDEINGLYDFIKCVSAFNQ